MKLNIVRMLLNFLGGMVLIFVSILVIAFFESCGPSREEMERRNMNGVQTKSIYESFSSTIKVIKIDSCEYILYQASHGASMVHKVNCINHGNRTE